MTVEMLSEDARPARSLPGWVNGLGRKLHHARVDAHGGDEGGGDPWSRQGRRVGGESFNHA